VKRLTLALLPLGFAATAFAQDVVKIAIPNPPPSATGPILPRAKPPVPVRAAPPATAPGLDALADAPTPPPTPPKGGTSLLMRGLDKITGRPTNIIAPIGRPVQFATLTITARFCYSTPASETPETTAFVQIEDHRPDQNARQIFSGWMYGSSPGLNGVEHPLYDVWVISCNNAPAPAVAANASTAPVKVAAPDSSDKEGIQALPEGAGQ
jgi:hypothetical protein